MVLLSNKIRREQLNPGDHIYTWRNGYSYSHHGIYVGDGELIHLTRAPGPIILSSSHDESSPSHPSDSDRVVCCSIEEFLSGGDLYLYEYGVKRASFLIKRGGTCTRTTSDPPKDVLHRASFLLKKGFGDYNLFQNNCEDFAIYCKTGLLTVDKSKPGRSGQIQFLVVTFTVVTLTPYRFLPSGLSSLTLMVYGLVYCFFRLLDDKDSVEKVAVEKFDLSYRRTVRMETDSKRSFSSLSASYYFAFIIWVLNYWAWTPASRILLWIRLVYICCSLCAFVSAHLRNHRMNVKLWEYVACIIWVLGYWYWSSESRIHFWTKLGHLYSVLLLFVSDQPRRLKVGKYISQTTFVLGLWYWTPESSILLWIRLLLLDLSLFKFIPDHQRNPRSKFTRFFAACVAIQSAAFLLGLDYRDYFFRITKSIFL